MVFVVEVKPGMWYVYESYRKPGYEYPFHRYLGPADQYRGGLKLVRQKQAKAAEREKHDPKELDYVEKENSQESDP